ncbi:MAG TPA: alpha/beta fold hydrolase [Solirubrobacteraceae bacterium]|nr:alpha/beta fold hydrolase [Solirubrobacteraceae bacterium]
MPTATVAGRELHYFQRGEGEPLLLIQGLTGTHLSWGDEFLDALARDFGVIVFDNRGVGNSSRVDEPFSIADMADDAAGVLDAVGVDRAHVLGVSMGGMIAQQLALRHADRIRTLTLGCTYSGGPGSVRTSDAVGLRLAEGWMSGDRERALRTGWEVNVSPDFAADEERYARFREAALGARAALAVIMLQVQAIGGHDVAARLGEIAAPTLVVHGDLDEMLSVENGRMIAAKIPGARLEILEGVGHLFWIEQPERSAGLIAEHARTQAAAAG